MISVTEWGEYIERLAGASGRINSWLVVADIAHLKEKLKETDTIEYPLLVGVIPSAYSSTTNDEDNVSELNVCLLFVLSPILRDYDSDAELNNYRDTHEALVDVKRTIRQDYFNCEQYPLLREIKFKSYVQEPEWNMLDLMGWSLGFEVETGEYSSTEPMPPMPPQPPVPPTYSGLRYEYTNEGLVIYQDVKNNYEEDGTFILLIQVGTNDPIMLRAWINTRETYTFATKALNLDNAQTYEVIAFDYTMQETARITLPAYDIFTYGTLTSIYADDADYNDVIRCSLTVTNNTSIAQNCIVYLKHNDYFVQLEEVVTENTAYTFTYDFADVDIFVENIVTFHDSAMNQLSSVTILATPQFEMYFEATEQNPQFYIVLMSWIPGNYIVYDDGTSEEISVVNSTYHYKTFAPGMHLIYFSNSKEIKNFRWLTNPETFLKPQIHITNQFWKLSNLQYLYLYLYTSDLWFENITILPNELLRMKKIETLVIRSIRNCPLKIYYPQTLGGLQFAQITNPQIENNFFQKLSNVSNIQAYLNYSTFSITLPELLFFPKITVAVIFIYFNCPNISRDSNLGNGYVYNFQNSKLTSQACDNLIYVIRNTNNYSGTSAKTLTLNGTYNARRTHASDADKAYLLSKGWVVTANEPL